jgi:tRNA A-37 threonylcarbamoyl transferase component Bud32
MLKHEPLWSRINRLSFGTSIEVASPQPYEDEIVIACWPYKLVGTGDGADAGQTAGSSNATARYSYAHKFSLDRDKDSRLQTKVDDSVDSSENRTKKMITIYALIWFSVGLFVLVFSAHMYGSGYFFFKSIGSLAAWMLPLLALLKGVTHIRCNADGIFLENRNPGARRSRSVMSWRSLREIYLVKRPGGDPRRYTLCFKDKWEHSFKIKLAKIATSENWRKLLSAIEAWSPVKPSTDCEDSLFDSLSGNVKDLTYTGLWLEALNAPPKRERLTPLGSGSTLKQGAYTLIRLLGSGGQGAAYLACTLEGSSVVLKEYILPVYVDVKVRKEAIEQFQREAKMLSQLDCPLIVKLLDFFVDDHRAYLVLEYIDGKSLKGLVDSQGPFSNNQVAQLGLMMCDILTYLHKQSPPVVHRDFTPDNLILDKNGSLKLIDFMIAQQSEDTSTATVVGKQSYISPEQFRGKANTQSDIYALGATLCFLLTGQDPEPLSTSSPIIACETVSPTLDKIVSKCTELDLEKRYISADQVTMELQRFMRADEASL